MTQSGKKKERKPQGFRMTKVGWIAGGVVAVIALIPLSALGPIGWLVGLAAGAAAGAVVSIMSTPLDLTTHNKQDQPAEEDKPRDYEEIPASGDAHADDVIERGKNLLRQIRDENDAIPDAEISAKINQLEDRCVSMLCSLAEKPGRTGQVRKFMSYYLPTTLKMLRNYHTMQDSGVSADQMTEAKAHLLEGLDLELTACQKQIDALYADVVLDTSVEIAVLEKMLQRDGYAEGGLGPSHVTAMAAQLAQTDVFETAMSQAEEAAGEIGANVPRLELHNTESHT